MSDSVKHAQAGVIDHAVTFPEVRPDNITIAITVYDRRKYISQAIRSALAQRQGTIGPRVMVVEDCGPNATLRSDIMAEFGNRITYHRNTRRRGLFGNWNACLEECVTPWLCILHDDDFLEPSFTVAMVELSRAAPERGLYYGVCHVVDAEGARSEERPEAIGFQWHELALTEWARYDPVCFPSQLFNVAAAHSLGGFRATSRYCADWEMWFGLAMNYGAAATNRVTANYREHHSIGRGTTDVDVNGKKYALVNAQRKKHIAEMRKAGLDIHFDRRALLKVEPMPTWFLLRHGRTFSPRLLRYNTSLLALSKAPHLAYSLFQRLLQVIGWRSVRPLSFFFGLFSR